MSITAYLLVFGSGLMAGMLILFVVEKINSGGDFNLFGGIGRLFSSLRRSPGTIEKSEEVAANPPQAVDPREQKLYDSAQTIRNILLITATNIQRTEKAASDSSLVLGDV